MKNLKKKWIIIAIWILAVCILKYFNLLSLDMYTLKALISEYKNYAYIVFIGLWIVRLIFLIPGTILMILGGICFSPVEAFLLSTVGIALSTTLIYIVSRYFASHKMRTYLVDRHPELDSLLETYNYKFLALGIIFPIAPADVICFLSASARIKYVTYLLTILIAGAPLRILYSVIGTSLGESKVGLAFLIVSFAIVFIASFKIWNNIKKKQKIQCE
ncbi:TVP38/TMEM64 family protein [Solibacillus sp. FSL K6-1523]|uniref:TVP38/TMEM64 family protein n=1 Tax=Solibacillus sp. FSL K6-1523 TaxID=2921471 RepID=UPI004046B178